MKILIAEDDPSVGALLEALLVKRGYVVELAQNGREALEKARLSPPDLIVSDVMMTEMDGFIFCRKVRGEGRLKNIPIILYTATKSEKDEEELALSMGAVRFIAKPGDMNVILDAVREELEKAGKAEPSPLAEPPGAGPEVDREYLRVLSRKLLVKERELAEALKRLAESEGMYQRLVENLPDIIYSFSVNSGGTYYSSSVEAVLGYRVDFLLGDPFLWNNSVHPVDLPRVARAVDGFIREKTPFDLEYRIKDKSGAWHWFRDRSIGAHLKGSEVLVDGIASDITARMRAEEALRESAERMRQVQKLESIGQLTGGIAHDLNNLLGPVIGYADLLRKSLPPGDPRLADVDEITKSAERAASLIRQLLAFSRKQMLAPRIISLNDRVNNIGAMLRMVIGDRIRLVTRLSPGIGPVKADPGQIEQVILNLVLNARDAMPYGGDIVVETAGLVVSAPSAGEAVGCLPPGSYTTLSVKDTGHGMSEAVKARMFEPFFTTKKPGKGTGLGLSTAYGIVKQSGGEIHVESEPGKGSVFTISLPLVEGTVEEAAKEAPAAVLAAGKGRVLVVDDDESMRRVTGRILTAAGYTVTEAAGGRQALAVLAGDREPQALMITDLSMPDMDGLALAGEASLKYPAMKILYVSGSIDKEEVLDKALGANAAYLQKPFSPDTLLKKIDELLRPA